MWYVIERWNGIRVAVETNGNTDHSLSQMRIVISIELYIAFSFKNMIIHTIYAQ